MNRFLSSLVLAATMLAVAQSLNARSQDGDRGVLVQVNRDVSIPRGDGQDVVVVIRGNAVISGDVPVVVLIDGALRLDSARVGHLVGIRADIDVGAGSILTDFVRLVNSDMSVDENATVESEVRTGFDFVHGAVVFGIAVGFGFALLVLLAGVMAAAVAPDGVRLAGTALSDSIGATVLSTVILWVGLPVTAGLLLFTIIGIPTALAIMVVVLPALWFLGYLIAGIRVGDWILEWRRHSVERAHPYLAAIVGLTALIIAGWLPFIGTIVTPVAALIGSGALAYVIWRRLYLERRPTV